MATTDEQKLALVRLWLAQWSTPARGIWFPSMTDGEWWRTKGGVKPHSGKFKPIERWLASGAARKKFNQQWLPVLLQHILRAPAAASTGCSAGKVALETGGLWGYCERCRYTQRPFPGIDRCVNCGAEPGPHPGPGHRPGVQGPQGLLPGQHGARPGRTRPSRR